MEKNHVCLRFDSVVTRLAGFDYGKEIYQAQVENQIDFSCPVVIEFPDRIIKIASSFVQGFFEDIIKQVGLNQIGNQVKVVARSPELVASIFNNLT